MRLIAVIFIMVLMLWIIFITIYNRLIKLRNGVKRAESGIDVYLNQRFDLIPNLVACVQEYSNHEKELLEEIAAMRTQYINQKNDLEQGRILNNKLNQLIAIVEEYPNLKASEQFLNLQKNLIKMESQLQAARRIYNIEVTEYNTKISVVPSNIIAAICGFKSAKLFEIEDYKRNNVNIKYEEK